MVLALTSRAANVKLWAHELYHVLHAERHARPSLRWLAEPGEVAAGLGDLEVLFLEEGWHCDRGVARAIARRA